MRTASLPYPLPRSSGSTIIPNSADRFSQLKSKYWIRPTGTLSLRRTIMQALPVGRGLKFLECFGSRSSGHDGMWAATLELRLTHNKPVMRVDDIFGGHRSQINFVPDKRWWSGQNRLFVGHGKYLVSIAGYECTGILEPLPRVYVSCRPDGNLQTLTPESPTLKKSMTSPRCSTYIPHMNPDQYPDFMAVALREAQMAFEKNEVPVGAIVVHENRVIGRGHNLTESLHDATAHAEMIALSAAFNSIGDWRLEDCYLFSHWSRVSCVLQRRYCPESTLSSTAPAESQVWRMRVNFGDSDQRPLESCLHRGWRRL